MSAHVPLRVRLGLPVAAAVSVAVAISGSEVSFALGRGSSLTPAYFGFCAGATLLVYASLGVLTGLLRQPAELAVILCIGFEGLVTSRPLSGATFLVAAMLAHHGRMRLLNPLTTLYQAVGAGFVSGLAVAIVQILWARVGFFRGLFGTEANAHSVTGAALLALLLLGSSGYAWVRARGGAGRARFGWLPPEPSLWLVASLGLFVALPATFDSQSSDLNSGTSASRSSDRPNILVVVLDTVRADHLGFYGYDRPTTPMLDRFLAEHSRAVVYPLAFASSPWTVPSHASLFTGLPLVLHGVHRGNAEQAYSYGSLPETPTLAESVKAAGYRTALIHANIFLRRIGGGMRGFEAAYMPPYMRLMTSSGEAIRKSLFPDFLTAHLTGYPSAADVNEGVLRFFAQAKPAPCFVIANYMEAHRPLLPRQPYAELFASMAPRRDESRPLETVEFEAAYDAEIRGLDERLVDLLNSLEKRGQLANTWVFITSDHGEAIGEHAEKIGHGIDVYNNEARIPLVVLPPEGVAIAVMHQAVGLLDVTATVSAIAASTRVGRGRDLRDPTETARATWVELYEKGQPAQPAVRAVIQGRSKLISRHGGTAELYQVLDDPHERVDLATAKPELVQLMSKLTPAKGSPVPHRPVQSNLIGPTLQEAAALRALGYAE